MAFRVFRPNERPLDCADGDRFEIVDGGALKITLANRSHVYYAPTSWVSIEETAPGPTAAPRMDVPDDGDDIMTRPF